MIVSLAQRSSYHLDLDAKKAVAEQVLEVKVAAIETTEKILHVHMFVAVAVPAIACRESEDAMAAQMRI